MRPSPTSARPIPTGSRCAGATLTGDLMGRLSFTEYFHLLLTGREPTEDQRYFLDLLLVAIAEHGMMPTNVAARMTLSADPGSLQGAVAAGILGCGPVILGTAEACAQVLEEAQSRSLPAKSRRRWPKTSSRGARGRRAHAGLRPSGPPPTRPARRADPRPRGRARRERAARAPRARFPGRCRAGLGQAAHDERLDADRRGDARPRLRARRREGGADPRAHGRAARTPRRGARTAARFPDGGRGGGGDLRAHEPDAPA